MSVPCIKRALTSPHITHNFLLAIPNQLRTTQAYKEKRNKHEIGLRSRTHSTPALPWVKHNVRERNAAKAAAVALEK
jgi:hypothetical protein